MKRLFTLALTVGLLGILFAGCEPSEDEETSGVVTLAGQILNAETNNPVANAFITVMPYNLLYETDEEGRFNIQVEIDSTMDLQVKASKDGYGTANATVLALAGRTVEVPTLRLTQTAEEGPISGMASNILLLEQSSQSIGVKESGSEEVAQVTFQVADSLGRPVTLDHAVVVRFTLGEQPHGGEFIYPEEQKTDNNGQATVNLSSGTKAGVVQIVAQATVGGRTIQSLPVSVAIHGGLPDQTHFSLGPERFNFPGLRRFGILNPISVVVGDKYSNPVKKGTAVYFKTTHGVIEGSVLTNEQGRGTLNLISANPLPADGVAVITASTADEGQAQVVDQTPVLFSGVPFIEISPTNVALNQTYSLRITDQNGNPLCGGTSIVVAVDGTKVKAVGHTNVKLDDTAFVGGMTYQNVLRGQGITEFTFRAVPNLGTVDEVGDPKVESITITVSGDNGTLSVALTGEGAQLLTRKPASIRTNPDGVTVAHLEE